MNDHSVKGMRVFVSATFPAFVVVALLIAFAFHQPVVDTVVEPPPVEETFIVLETEEVVESVEEIVSEPVEEEIVINTIEVLTITYTVVKGDSLWKIAGELLDDPTEWPSIWGQNADQIEDPDLIFPGQVLTITLTSAGTASIT